MKSTRKTVAVKCLLLVVTTVIVTTNWSLAQVSPTEVLNPRAKADEQKYLPQLVSVQRAIGTTQFPFTFRLARYLDAKPGQRAALDSNGIEFVYFQQRVVLKVSGFYRVAFDAIQLNQNARASQAFEEAVMPILRLVTQQVPQNVDCDGIGFEILYDARDKSGAYDYEGHEVLAIVFGRDDAFALAHATTVAERQDILNRSDVFVNGKEFGLALGQRDSLDLRALGRSGPRQDQQWSSSTSEGTARVIAVSEPTITPAVSRMQPKEFPKPATASADSVLLNAQTQLEAAAAETEQGAKPHLEQLNPPALETSGEQRLLRFTMQNTLSFERNTTSIYKRAAQSFDLFLAPELKDITRKLPTDVRYDTVAFSVLNHFGSDNYAAETIEYICPMDSMRSFVENKITTQDLINKSMVLVNGVRIGVDLQLVE
jgi:hypothetical protein